jgi:hypothetical protein
MSVARQYYANQVTSASHLLLLLVGARIGTRGGWIVILVVIGILSLLLWMLNYRRARAVGDTPTSRIASAPQGYVELAGLARPFPGDRLISPVSRIHCVWYHYIIEEKRGKDWRKVDEAVSHDSFLIDDGTGEAVIDPDFGEVHTTRKRSWYVDKRRFTEWLLVPSEALYVIGEFATEGGANARLDHAADVNALLAKWKADKAELKRRFDLDGNGEVDLKEWELARKAARREVQKQHQEIRSQPGIHMLRKPRDGRHFLISNLDPDRLARRYGMWTSIQLGVALLSGVTILLLLATAGS